jgi:hypothetical protein
VPRGAYSAALAGAASDGWMSEEIASGAEESLARRPRWAQRGGAATKFQGCWSAVGLVKAAMEKQTLSRPHGVPESFYSKFGQHVTAVLSGFDRIRFRGILRMLFNPAKMDLYLGCCGVLLKEFGSFAERMTARVKEAADEATRRAGRPIQYLNSGTDSKEELARHVAQRDRISSGLIALFTAVEPCLSYAVRGDRRTKEIKLVLETRKCTHLYHYYMDREFGLMHVRLQSWFPFTVDICLNARHWLAHQLAQVMAFGASAVRMFCAFWANEPSRAAKVKSKAR